MRKAFLLLVVSLIVTSLGAANYISGYFCYQYIGMADSNKTIYAISLILNRDCYSSQKIFPNTINIGIYENNTQATLVEKRVLKMVDEKEVEPFVSPNISVGYCLRQHTYTDTVVLPNNATGYQLYYSVQNSYYTAQVIYGIIPANANDNKMLLNNMAAFYAMQTGETFTTDLDINKTDGDSLTYKITMPYYRTGNDVSKLPNRIDVESDLRVDDISNISALLGGWAGIDAATGKINVKATNPSRFSFSVEVIKWRNGNSVATYRLPLVIQSIVKNYPTSAYISISGTKKSNAVMLSWEYSITAVKQFYIERKLSTTKWQRIDSTLALNGNDNNWFVDTVERRYRVVAVGEMNKIPITVISDEWKTGGQPTGVKYADDYKIKVYPNPVTDKIFFMIPNNLVPQKLLVYDALGKTVFEGQYENMLSFNHLPSGVYSVFIKGEEGCVVGRFIKQ